VSIGPVQVYGAVLYDVQTPTPRARARVPGMVVHVLPTPTCAVYDRQGPTSVGWRTYIARG
jgi:hypothetical protein